MFFQQERFPEARKKLAPLVRTVPNVSEVQELHGLICYRINDYETAAFSLEQFRSLAQSTERHPILMDCYRSEKRWADVKFLWDELAEVSPDAETVAEGKIIYANSFADQGNYPKAINILEKGWRTPTRPQEHHLRKAYALADLYDRAGMPVKARELFSWITSKSGSYLDASDRHRQLS
jgi:tetratricopeptide (TPR) repeat protein